MTITKLTIIVLFLLFTGIAAILWLLITLKKWTDDDDEWTGYR